MDQSTSSDHYYDWAKETINEIIQEIIIETPKIYEKNILESIYGFNLVKTIEQHLPNICGFYSLFNAYFCSNSIVEFWKFYFQLIRSLNTVFEGDFDNFQELQRYHLDYILSNQIIQQLDFYSQLNKNSDQFITTLFYGYNIIQNSEDELVVLQQQFDQIKQRQIEKLTIICGITIHFLVVELRWEEGNLVHYVYDSQNESLTKLFSKQRYIDKSKPIEKRRRQAYKIDLRNLLIIIQQILHGIEVVDCYLEHAMQALRESFDEYEDNLEKWLKNEYPLPVIRHMIFKVALKFNKKCTKLNWLMERNEKVLQELQSELSNLI